MKNPPTSRKRLTRQRGCLTPASAAIPTSPSSITAPSENQNSAAASPAEAHLLFGTVKISGAIVGRLMTAGANISPNDLLWDTSLGGPAKTFSLRVSQHSQRISAMVFSREETASASKPPFATPIEEKIAQLVAEVLRIVKKRPAPQ
jgi:hypothetical protein